MLRFASTTSLKFVKVMNILVGRKIRWGRSFENVVWHYLESKHLVSTPCTKHVRVFHGRTNRRVGCGLTLRRSPGQHK